MPTYDEQLAEYNRKYQEYLTLSEKTVSGLVKIKSATIRREVLNV